jgi:hypothetical protein
MAERVKKDSAKKGRGRKKPADDEGGGTGKGSESPSMGHNLTTIRKDAEPIFQRLAKLQADMESQMGEFRVDFKNLYEEGANKIGCSRKILRKEFRRYLNNLRQEQEEQEMEASEREQIETLRAALGDTPFGRYIEGQLAEASGG